MNRNPHDVMHRIVAPWEVENAIDSAALSVGLQALKPTQLEAIRTFARGRDVFVALPTGHGGVVLFRPVVPRFRPHTRPQWLYSVVCVSPDISYDGSRRSMGQLGIIVYSSMSSYLRNLS